MSLPCVGPSKIGLVECRSISSASGRTLLPSGTQVLMGLLTQSHTYESAKHPGNIFQIDHGASEENPSPPAAKWDTSIGGEGEEWGVNDEYVDTKSDIFITGVNRLILLHKHFPYQLSCNHLGMRLTEGFLVEHRGLVWFGFGQGCAGRGNVN